MELSERELDRIHRINRKNGYGLTPDQLAALTRRHKKARKSGDTHTMELVEYRLTDINFHHECGMMARGEYAELEKEIQAWKHRLV